MLVISRRSLGRAVFNAHPVSSPSSLASQVVARSVRSPLLSRSILLAARRSYHASDLYRQSGAAANAQESDEPVSAPDDGGNPTTFQELADRGLVYKPVVEAITKGMGHNTMTEVQAMTIGQTLRGDDVLAQARTGTGKTIAFLLPLIQNLLRDPQLRIPQASSRYRARRDDYRAEVNDIRGLIISPTRELAEQIAVEAQKLCRNTAIQVQTAVGGTGKGYAMSRMRSAGCHLLVATPGRLFDILTDPDSRVSAPKLNTLVLDEADRLLDQGFSQAILEIIGTLPDRSEVPRQTMLYSATVPPEVMGLVRKVLLPSYETIRTVKPGDDQTHRRIPQHAVACVGVENNLPALLELCKRELTKEDQSTPFKAIVFFQTTAEVELGFKVFRALSSLPDRSTSPIYPAEVLQIHSRLSQISRTVASQNFRRAKSALLFATDVVARGMDFPNVTHVIQMGPPQSPDQYVHRLGRTGRGDKTGVGYIMIANYARRNALKTLRTMNLKADSTIQAASVDLTREASLPTEVVQTLNEIKEAMKRVDYDVKATAYKSLLSTGQTNDKQATIDALNCWAKFGMGLAESPGLHGGLIQKLGLAGVSGVQRETGFDGGRDGGRFGASRTSGGYGRDRGDGYRSNRFTHGDGESSRRSFTRGDGESPRRSFGADRGRGGAFGGDRGDRGDRGGYGRDQRSERGGNRRDNDRRSFL